MHCLYGLAKQGFEFELKGGTSLSKGFGIIERFSEDIDIRIDPAIAPFQVFCGKNHSKPRHIESRKIFYDWLADQISIEGIIKGERDSLFDDVKYRSGGIRLFYESLFSELKGLREGVLLELGFDDTTPNIPVTISSWAFDKATESGIAFTNNQAIDVKCYHPGDTFVEKLQTVSTKFRTWQENGDMPDNFMRHYYDIAQLLDHTDVQDFVGTDDYHERKKVRFRKDDNLNLSENEAFLISDAGARRLLKEAFTRTRALYYNDPPSFDEVLDKIQAQLDKL